MFPSTYSSESASLELETDAQNFRKILQLMEDDLEDPHVDSDARRFLRRLKRQGYVFQDPCDDEGCFACLYLSLLSVFESNDLKPFH